MLLHIALLHIALLHIVLLHIALLHIALLHIALLHFALLLHFAAIVITFCVSITFCGVTGMFSSELWPSGRTQQQYLEPDFIFGKGFLLGFLENIAGFRVKVCAMFQDELYWTAFGKIFRWIRQINIVVINMDRQSPSLNVAILTALRSLLTS